MASIVLFYYQFGSFSRFAVFRFEQREYVRRFAEAALNEAAQRFYRKTARPGSAEYEWVIGETRNGPVIEVTSVEKAAKDGVPPGFEIMVSGVQVNRVSTIATNRNGVSLYGKEKMGTLEFQSSVELRRKNGEKVAGCSSLRHHEYKVAAIVTPPPAGKSRASYAPAFPLDYCLLVRHGGQEFSETAGRLLNPDSQNLELCPLPDAQKPGKIYFGDQSGSSAKNPVFLNIDNQLRELIPPAPADITLDKSECMLLFPGFAQSKQVWHQSGLKGVISHRYYPISPPLAAGDIKAKDRVEAVRQLLLAHPVSTADSNEKPAIRILKGSQSVAIDPAAARTIFEGALKQRFFHFAFFKFDLPGGTGNNVDEKLFECLPPKLCKSQDTIDFARGLEKLRAQKNDDRISTSSLDTSFLFQKTLSSTGAPADFGYPSFFHSSGKNIAVSDGAFIPYDHWEVWNKGFIDPEVLESLGYLDHGKKRISARGIVRIAGGEVVIGDPQKPDQKYTVRGSGVWFANRVTLYAGIEKENPDDVFILMTYPGSIQVKTSQKIQASLIAVNDKNESGCGTVIAGQPMEVEGAVVVDRLRLQQWAAGKHRISYDPALKSTSALYAAVFSPVPVFQSQTEIE
jgi:hypothetical protein